MVLWVVGLGFVLRGVVLLFPIFRKVAASRWKLAASKWLLGIRACYLVGLGGREGFLVCVLIIPHQQPIQVESDLGQPAFGTGLRIRYFWEGLRQTQEFLGSPKG